MGNPEPLPSPQPPFPPLQESRNAISLQAAAPASSGAGHEPLSRYFDDPMHGDGDDLPPLYSEHAAPVDPLVPRDGDPLVQPFGHDGDGTTSYYVDGRLDSDPAFLIDHMQRLAVVPPRPFVRLRGTHRERQRGRDEDRRGDRQVVDFDIRIELTHLLYTDIGRQQAWRGLVTASNLERVRRGTVFARRAPASNGAVEEGVPGLDQWCHRFCASPAGLKCFTLERRVLGWDWDLVRRRLEALVRATNYRGHAVVSFPVRNARVDVYNDCRTNRWRLTGRIRFLFYATFLFLLTWPWLLLRTRRWETVTAEWHASQPTSVPGRKQYAAGMGEEQWYALWAKAIQRAMLERRDGELDRGDLERAQAGTVGGEGWLASAVGTGVEAMDAVNRSFGWGGDQC